MQPASNIEKLLKTLLNGDALPSDFIPRSRAEAYLKACINKSGTSGLPTEQSRLDTLLIDLVEVLTNGSGGIGKNFSSLVDKSITTITSADLSGATEIGDYAFYNLKDLVSIEIPSSVTKICNRAFGYCSSLASVVIPPNVTEIENYSFRYCSSLVNVRIEAINIILGPEAFNIGSETKKATITMLATTPPAIQANTFNANTLNKIVVPIGCGNIYKAATNWANFAAYIVEATA